VPGDLLARVARVTDERPWAGRRLHLIGIGGAGMSGLATVAAALGAEVSGSDRAQSPALERLRAQGIAAVAGHRAENVPEGAEVVYSSAIAAENPERRPGELHRSDLLAEVAALRRCIAVAGTHGKTTTSSMVVHALRGCGLDPAYLVGGEVRSTGANAGWGSGEWVVVEADESDRSLLKLAPDVAVLTNAELDHHAQYGSVAEVHATFAAFLGSAAEAVVVWDRPQLRALAPAGMEVVAFDVEDPQLGPDGVRFDWRGLEVRLRIPGAHNALNAAAALEACRLAGADPARAAAALADFEGAGRRFELLGTTAAGATFYDDYAHHPTEVAATLAAARTLNPSRVVAVFQPHLYSRTRALARPFGAALAAADLVVVLDVYPSRERPEDFVGVDGKLVADAAAEAAEGRTVAWLPTQEDAERFLRRALRPGDVCLTIGAGDVDALGRRLVAP
jgi:UDP-N-acetylmuramate--alanine ligase